MAISNAPRSDTGYDDAGKLIFRVTFGVLILLHGIAKITGGLGFIAAALEKAGVSEGFGYLAYIGEVIAPLFLILGAWSRVAALVIAINMIVAVMLAHTGQLFSLAPSGGYELELQAIYLFGAVSLALMGAGSYSLAGRHGHWN